MLSKLRSVALSLGGDLLTARGRACLILPAASLPRFPFILRRERSPSFVLLAERIDRYSHPDRAQAWRCGKHRLPLSKRVHLMGIVNVTPDSFSDGGKFYAIEKAVQRARDLIAEGADIIDIGGESTRPGADPVSEQEETRRVLPVIEKLAREVRVPISVDTTKASVARRAIEAGASIVNDVSAMRFDPGMTDVVRDTGSGLVLMHMKGSPRTMQRRPAYRSLMGEVFHFLSGRLEFALSRGIRAGQIVVDPGIGFGKTARHNLEILHRLPELLPIGRPLLVGPSRKSFIGKVLGLPPTERLEGTTAAVAAAVLGGARLIRVHDVAVATRVVKVAEAIRREKMGGPD